MNVRFLMLATVVALVLPACGDDDSDGKGDAGPDGSLPIVRDAGPSVIPACGNGFLETGESCDDGDLDSGDGCSATCTLEPSWECKNPGYSCARAIVCGDGMVSEGELCDDGNALGGDGCSADCKSVETNFACPTPNALCVSTMICGDGKVIGNEQCDDGNLVGGDGCSADCKMIEDGWSCPFSGARCRAAKCGDGKVVGAEQCDDGMATPASGDGCSDHCLIEAGWVCPGNACHKTVCGDKKTEGSEQCDDGNTLPFDGCYQCQNEPSCGNQSACTAVCGDGIVFPGETCDDGNTLPNDGCSADCKTLERGYMCTATTDATPGELSLPLIYRDFRGRDLPAVPSKSLPVGHADFEPVDYEAELGIVGPNLGSNKKPVYAAPLNSPTTHGKAAFDQWYVDTPNVNLSIADSLHLVLQGDGSYVFDDQYAEQQDDFPDGFFPLDGKGWVARGDEAGRDGGHNFHFTSELRYWFQYKGGEQLTFRGDDDVWVFVNGHLAVDLGGIHSQQDGMVTLDAQHTFGMTADRIYEVVVFQAERHTTESSYRLTLNGFEKKRTRCAPNCGDGILTPNEVCDNTTANNKGGYGECNADCQGYGPRCGDGTIQADKGEECDNGVNLGGYGPSGCTAQCKLAPRCGDGKVDGSYGEQCDDGTNAGGYNKCAPGCKLGDRCGDGVIQGPETCDDGNNVASDGCDNVCNPNVVI